MRKRLASSIALGLILMSCPAAVKAQDNMVKPIETLRESVLQLVDFFKAMIGSVDSLALAEDHRRLVTSLSRLSKSLFDLEQDKRFLLLAAERRPVNVAGVRQAIEDSEDSLKDVRERLRTSGFSLRQQFRLQGQEIERSLTELTGSRKNWLEDLDDALAQNKKPDFGPIIEEGKELVEALALANQRLIELIDALQRRAEG